MARGRTVRTAGSLFSLGIAMALMFGSRLTCAGAENTATANKAAAGDSAKKTAIAGSKAKEWKSKSSATGKSAAPRRPLPNVDLKNSAAVAAAVDKLILENLAETGTEPAPRTSDEDFLRRIHFDLAGTVPLPREVTLFCLDPDPQKRTKAIDHLVQSEEYTHNWAEYWRDVIFLRATEVRSRAAQGVFEKWMAGQIRENKSWDKIATDLITATGVTDERGETALMFAHAGQAPEIAAEVSRIFLGIQIQCANCHDHPNDKWKRQQFHQLAAFFPRVSVKREKGPPVKFEIVSVDPKETTGKRANRAMFAGKGKGKGKGNLLDEHPEQVFARLDRNGDGRVTLDEVKNTRAEKQFERLIKLAGKDGGITLAEFKNRPAPGGRKRATPEYYMPDLKNPSSQGTRIEPVFFVNGKRPSSGLRDEPRRHALAKLMTSPSDPWFSRAYANRIWGEMLGEGFYMPIDDIGPERQARMPEVLDLLAEAFVANHYDMKFLFRTIALTQTYQREIRAKDPSVESPPVFAASAPKRLRADQLFNAITKILGIDGADPAETEGMAGKGKRPARGARAQFAFLFGYDPSTSQDELQGNVPQALFMMNSNIINTLIHAQGKTRLSHILNEYKADEDAVKEVYVLTLAREPSDKEEKICLDYVHDVGNRREGFEDVMWSLMNSSEFLSKR